MDKKTLNQLRRLIEKNDKKILSLVIYRAQLVRKVRLFKKKNKIKFKNKKQEELLTKKLVTKSGKFKLELKKIHKFILSSSHRMSKV